VVSPRNNQIKKVVSWSEIERGISFLIKQIYSRSLPIRSVYGIPRGGVLLAVILSNRLGLEFVQIPRKDSLIVDDIADSGKTLSKFKNIYYLATLYYKNKSVVKPDLYYQVVNEKTWIVFPWEGD